MICLLIIFLCVSKGGKEACSYWLSGNKMSWKSEVNEISNGAVWIYNGTGGTEGEHVLLYDELLMPQTELNKAFMHSQCPHK